MMLASPDQWAQIEQMENYLVAGGVILVVYIAVILTKILGQIRALNCHDPEGDYSVQVRRKEK